MVASFDNSERDTHGFIAKVDFLLIRRGEVGEPHDKVGSPEGSASRPDLAPPSPGPGGTRCFQDNPGDTAPPDPAQNGIDDLGVQEIEMLTLRNFKIDGPISPTIQTFRDGASTPKQLKINARPVAVRTREMHLATE